jgi:hypothetical protein
LINPETKLVTEIVMDGVTNGSNPYSRPAFPIAARPGKGVDEYAVRSFSASERDRMDEAAFQLRSTEAGAACPWKAMVIS